MQKRDGNSRPTSIWYRFCVGIKKHWIVTAIFITFSGWWFSLCLAFLGEFFKLTATPDSGGRRLTLRGWICTVIVLAFTVLFTIANKRNQTNTEEVRQLEDAKTRVKTHERILALFGEGCEQKVSAQLKCLDKVIFKNKKPSAIYTNPCSQLRQLLDALRDMLSTILTIPGSQSEGHRVVKDDIYASLAYRMTRDNNGKAAWQWADVYVKRGLGLEKLTEPSAGSTFMHLITSGNNFVFYNSKETAKNERHYLVETEDVLSKDGKLCGSIACYKIDVKYGDEVYIEAVLSLSTYKVRFAREYDADIDAAIGNMRDFVIHEFERRIRVELCNLLMHTLNEEQERIPDATMSDLQKSD